MLLTIITSAILIAADQLTKFAMANMLLAKGSQVVIKGFLGLQYVENTGMAFGLLEGKQLLLIIVTGIALLGIAAYLLFKKPADKLEYISLILVFSGGVGNLIDRIARGYVVDFLEFLFIDFAVFNLADCFVCVGLALFLISIIHAEIKQKKNNNKENAAEEKSIKGSQ